MKNNSFKKILSAAISAALCISALAACGTKNETAKTGSTDGKVYKIGVTQIADHPSLDNCREGFIEGLKNAGFVEGKNVEIEFQSAKNDTANAGQIAQNFASLGKDLVCGISTPSAQALYTACYEKGIPVIFNAISDPVAAKLAKSETEAMDGNTGISDALPVEAQLKLIRSILPDAKKIGIIYTTSEANSVSTIETYKKLAPKYNFEIVERGIGNQSEVAQAADVVLKDADCISNLTDNTVVAALSVVLEKANAAGKPVFGSEEEQVGNGCLASAGLDYFKLGEQAGAMAARVLNGEKVSSIPYETMKESSITINPKVAEALGITIPEDVSKDAQIKE